MTITSEEFDYMLENPGVRMFSEDGTSTVHYASGDKTFVMTGPKGRHSLYAPATDLDRLNAHWAGFSGER